MIEFTLLFIFRSKLYWKNR